MYMIKDYIKFKQGNWAASTAKSESSRLSSILYLIELEEPKTSSQIVKVIKDNYDNYAAKTAAIRLADYYKFKGDSSLADYLRTNTRLFKHVYTREVLEITYDQALAKISQIKDEDIRNHALAVLQSGLRWCESLNVAPDGQVKGKGGKVRKVFTSATQGYSTSYRGTYMRFYRSLKSVGLKPHTLRKLAATHFANKGLAAHELTYVMGWSSIQTALLYLQPKADSVIMNKIRDEEK